MHSAKRKNQEETLHSGERVDVQNPPDEEFAANLDDKVLTQPDEGFGRLWERTYRVRLEGSKATAAEVMANWKRNFPIFQPEENRFMPTEGGLSEGGIAPGAIIYIGADLVPGATAISEVKSGVQVVHADALSFTVQTPEGFPVSGWNHFSTFDEAGAVVAQVHGRERANDPLYEFGYRFLGGAKQQEKIWTHVLESLAEFHGVSQPNVQKQMALVDARVRWRNAGNLWQNAAVRTLLLKLTSPFRRTPASTKSETRVSP